MSQSTENNALDALLRLIDLRCEVYHNQQLCGDWELSEHAPGQTCFHLVSHGRCELSWRGQSWQLEAGDLILFPAEEPHRLRTLTPDGNPMQKQPLSLPLGDGHTGLMCASVTFAHRAARDLLSALPTMTLMRCDEKHAEWLQPLLGQILRESQQPLAGQAAIIDHLAELLFMQAIRHYNQNSDAPEGILALQHDARISRALSAFHAAPEEHWPLSRLAEASAMSRSRFAYHFRAISGWTPAQYLTWWRMQLAWSGLASGESVLNVAQSVGYQSEAAFSRIFSKTFGVSAGVVRRQHGQPKAIGVD